jgi:O-antigen ligase
MGVYLAVTAVAEVQQIEWLVFPKYILSTERLDWLGRARGPLLNPVSNGLLLTAMLLGLLMFWPEASRPGKAMILALSGLLWVGIYCTQTRSVWIGAGVAVLTILGLALPRNWRWPVLGGAVMVAGLVVFTQWDQLIAFQRDRVSSAEDTAASARLRPVLARVAWNMFLDRPLVGCGLAHYEDEVVYYLHDRSTELPLETARPFAQHNVFFALLTETGLPGMGLFSMMLGLWAYDGWRLWRDVAAAAWFRRLGLLLLAILAAYLVNGLFHDVSLLAMISMLLYYLAGLTSAVQSQRAHHDAP